MMTGMDHYAVGLLVTIAAAAALIVVGVIVATMIAVILS
jgi:hypothetical protein